MPGVVQFAESRTPGSDGAYTDQQVIEVEPNTQLGWFTVQHDLKRTPDWVRITKLTYGQASHSPVEPNAAKLEPAINVPQTLLSKRLAWDAGEVGNTDGRPTSVAELDRELWFGAENQDRISPVKFLVEFGITHSTPK